MMPLDILVVDDDADNANSLGELFELEGHRVHVVHSGEDAVTAYCQDDFDLAFMDVMMPGKNGVESFLEIRRLKPQARVYMMTGYSVEELLLQAIRGGALGVLDKPFDAGEVLRLTETVGPGGVVLASPVDQGRRVGEAIQAALRTSGRTCHLVRRPDDHALLADDEILVIDTGLPLIDEVSALTAFKGQGHRGPAFLIPPAPPVPEAGPLLRDIGVTGVLNKPFDPLDLISRLPRLAA